MGRARSKAVLSAVAALALGACSSGSGGGGGSLFPPPVITSVTPTSGPSAGGTAVTITGTSFRQGAIATVAGTVAPVTSFSATALVILTPPHGAGPADIKVTNPDGQSATRLSAFVYVSGPPVLTSVSPTSGATTGGTAVTLSGANFQAGATVLMGAASATVTSVSATSISVVTPAHAAGVVDVTVSNPDALIATLPGAFTYLSVAPVLSSVTPATGNVAGGTSVTLSGSNFQQGASVTFGGLAATVHSVSATSIAAQTPAHAVGAVDVTVTNLDAKSVTLTNGFTYSTTTPTSHLVTLSWNANRESGVNQTAGGYRVNIAGQPTIVVPFVSGPLAPTTTNVTLQTGSYTVTVTAFAALDAQGGATGSTSAPSQSINVVVP